MMVDACTGDSGFLFAFETVQRIKHTHWHRQLPNVDNNKRCRNDDNYQGIDQSSKKNIKRQRPITAVKASIIIDNNKT